MFARILPTVYPLVIDTLYQEFIGIQVSFSNVIVVIVTQHCTMAHCVMQQLG